MNRHDSGLRIAHFTLGRCNQESANGVDKAVFYLSKAQAALGHSVAVFSLTEKPPIEIPGVTVRTYPRDGSLGARFGSRFRLPECLLTGVADWGPDILHLHSVHIPENILLSRYLRRAGTEYCVTVHGGLSPVRQKRNRWLKRALKVIAEQRYFEAAAFVHAISECDAKEIRAYGVRNQIVVAPNGIDLGSVPQGINPGQLATRFPRLQGKRIFLFLGRLDPDVKGLDLLVEAFAAADLEGAALVFVGPDWRGGQKQIVQLAQQLGVASRIVFTGPAFGQVKYDLLSEADVFVHPSRSEAGVPFSVLEAAAMGKPCLMTPPADPGGLFGRRMAGICVEPNVLSIANGLQRFSAMEAHELREMGNAARHLMEVEFNWPASAQILVKAYRTYAVQNGA